MALKYNVRFLDRLERFTSKQHADLLQRDVFGLRKVEVKEGRSEYHGGDKDDVKITANGGECCRSDTNGNGVSNKVTTTQSATAIRVAEHHDQLTVGRARTLWHGDAGAKFRTNLRVSQYRQQATHMPNKEHHRMCRIQ